MRGSRSHVVVAAVAFAIGATGSATAAKLVSGKDIRDGTITSKDLSKSLRAQLKLAGKPGPAGTPGTPGAAGSQGSAGPAGPAGPAGSTAPVMPTVLASDGPGSGLDADLLDGVDSANLVARSGSTMTGPLRLATGTAVAPSLAFDGDVNTGVYSSAADELRFAAGGVARMIVRNDGVEIPAGSLQYSITTIAPSPGSCDAVDEYGRTIIFVNGTGAAELWICDNDISANVGLQTGWVVK
jgi:hypothetical protein